MTLKKLFGRDVTLTGTNKELSPTEEKRITGTIFHVAEDKGWGFITSEEIKFTRIFFHWTALEQDTLHFTQLQKGMKVEFTPRFYEASDGKESQGWRAIKIKVIEE